VDRIDPKLSAVENFLILNKTAGGNRRLTPIASFGISPITLSELDLVALLWNVVPLRYQMRKSASGDYPGLYIPAISQIDVNNWLSRASPGVLINKLLTDIGGYSESERKKLKSFSKSALRMSTKEMRNISCHSSTTTSIQTRTRSRTRQKDIYYEDRSKPTASASSSLPSSSMN